MVNSKTRGKTRSFEFRVQKSTLTRNFKLETRNLKSISQNTRASCVRLMKGGPPLHGSHATFHLCPGLLAVDTQPCRVNASGPQLQRTTAPSDRAAEFRRVPRQSDRPGFAAARARHCRYP